MNKKKLNHDDASEMVALTDFQFQLSGFQLFFFSYNFPQTSTLELKVRWEISTVKNFEHFFLITRRLLFQYFSVDVLRICALARCEENSSRLVVDFQVSKSLTVDEMWHQILFGLILVSPLQHQSTAAEGKVLENCSEEIEPIAMNFLILMCFVAWFDISRVRHGKCGRKNCQRSKYSPARLSVDGGSIFARCTRSHLWWGGDKHEEYPVSW